MSPVDALIVVSFVVYAVAVGLRNRRQASKNLEEYFLAGRSLPGWKAGLSMAATQFAADTPLLVTGLVATAGIFGLWQLWIFGVTFLVIGFVLAGAWRRAGVVTDAELTEVRYGATPAAVLRCGKALYFGTIINCVSLAWVLFAAAKIAEPFLLLERMAAGCTLPTAGEPRRRSGRAADHRRAGRSRGLGQDRQQPAVARHDPGSGGPLLGHGGPAERRRDRHRPDHRHGARHPRVHGVRRFGGRRTWSDDREGARDLRRRGTGRDSARRNPGVHAGTRQGRHPLRAVASGVALAHQLRLRRQRVSGPARDGLPERSRRQDGRRRLHLCADSGAQPALAAARRRVARPVPARSGARPRPDPGRP